MKKIVFLVILLLPLLIISCTKENPVTPPPDTKSPEGKLLLKLDNANTPFGVTTILATLSRTGYDSLSRTVNVSTDTTTDISFSSVAIGFWHLRIDAKSSLGTILYTGESDVTINEASTTQVSLTLKPTGLGVGNIAINILWGADPKWIDYWSGPILTKQNTPRNPLGGVSAARVLQDNGKFKMWYTNTYEGGVGDVGYAESSDGIAWTVVNGSVLSPGQSGAFDDLSACTGPIIKEGSEFRLYYNAVSYNGSKATVGLATSTDGIHWQKRSAPVFTPSSFEEKVGLGDIVKVNGVYYLYYSYVKSTGIRAIAAATSTDGITWTKYANNPILTQDQTWEGQSIYAPTVIYENNQFKLMYMNFDATGFGMAFSSNGFNFQKSSLNPIMTAQKTNNKWCSKIAYPYWVKLDNHYRIYYSGAVNSAYQISFLVKNF